MPATEERTFGGQTQVAPLRRVLVRAPNPVDLRVHVLALADLAREDVPDSVARAMRHVTDAGLDKRIRIEAREIPSMPYVEEFDLVYMQDALHELPDPVASLKAAWKAVRAGGRLLVFEWCLPSSLEDSQNLQAQLMWGIQIDELYQGTRMYTHDGYDKMFAEAEVPPPSVVELPSGASLFVVARPA